MARVLVTCVGSGVGQSVVDSLNLVGKDYIIGCDANPNVYAARFCHELHISPNIYSEGYINFLLDFASAEKIDIIIPGHDHELLLLSNNVNAFNEIGVEVLVSTPEIIAISRDKHEWYNFFNKKGCPVVPTFRVDEFRNNPDNDFFPAIVKPAGGSASQGIKIIDDSSQLDGLNDGYIIQPYLFPPPTDENYDAILNAVKNHKFLQLSEISIQLVFSKESELEGIFISQNSLKSGIPVFINPIQPEEFEYLNDILSFVPILKEHGVRGPVNIQGRITQKGLVCFEMNMRFTGITGNRAQFGFNEVKFLVDNFLGKESVLGKYSRNKIGVRQVACTTIPRRDNSSKHKKTFAIFGADGFVGSSFVNFLLNSNISDRIYLISGDDFYNRTKSLFNDIRINVINEHDNHVESVLSESDVAINFASALANNSDKQIYDAILFQYKQSRKILKAGIPLVINVSSQSVYNQLYDKAKKEDDELDLSNAYAFQKRIAEMFFEEATEFYPMLNVVSLRFSRIIGCHYSGKKPNGFFANVIESLIKNREVNIPYPCNKINLIDIKDVISAIIHVINQQEKVRSSGVYNVCGENITIRQYCDKVIETLNYSDKQNLIHFADSSEITTSSMVDCSSFVKTGWKRKYKLEDSIMEMYHKLMEDKQ
jgi:nucleoside-diphosphate-sugar epimerase